MILFSGEGGLVIGRFGIVSLCFCTVFQFSVIEIKVVEWLIFGWTVNREGFQCVVFDMYYRTQKLVLFIYK